MLSMALELAKDDPAYEDMASKFFEHFVAIADAINTLGGSGLWDEEDGFYYDQLHADGAAIAAARALDGRPVAADRGRGAGGRGHRPAAGVQEADAAGSWRTAATWPARSASAEGDATRHAAAGHPVARAAGARAALPARRERVPVALRDPLAVARARAGALPVLPRRARSSGSTTCPAKSTTGLFGGNSQLARAGLVPGQLPADRGAGALPPLLRRRAAGRVPDRLGPAAEPGARWRGELARPAGGAVPARRRRRAAPATAATAATPTTRTSATCCCSTSTSTARPAAALGASHQTGWTALVIRFLEDAARRS